MIHFDGCIEAIEQNSPNAKVFALIHKMDLVPEEQREKVHLFLNDCIRFIIKVFYRYLMTGKKRFSLEWET